MPATNVRLVFSRVLCSAGVLTAALRQAGAVLLAVNLGVVHLMPGDGNVIGDIVPVDYVVNSMLAAVPAIANQNRFAVYHSGTSVENPFRWALVSPLADVANSDGAEKYKKASCCCCRAVHVSLGQRFCGRVVVLASGGGYRLWHAE